MWSKKKAMTLIRLERLSDPYKKREPRCACCGYDAEHIVQVETLERLLCEKCLVNALLDAINFNCGVH